MVFDLAVTVAGVALEPTVERRTLFEGLPARKSSTTPSHNSTTRSIVSPTQLLPRN